jgi:3-dehydroquinate synthase
VHIPTSLLAQVDSSIGGKVGINHISGKNLIGSFYQPQCVIIDTSVLQTLPQEELICGLGEIVKYGIISDAALFSLVEENLQSVFNKNPQILTDLVYRCAKIKADIVSKDEKEAGIRSVLNLGHTFGHALETYYGYQNLKHGQAVMLGIRCAAYLSQKQGLLPAKVKQRIDTLIKKMPFVLPHKNKSIDTTELISIMKKDKKIKQGKINLILIKEIGEVIKISTEQESQIMEAFSSLYATGTNKE